MYLESSASIFFIDWDFLPETVSIDLASDVAALASVGVRVSGSTPNSSVQVDSSRAWPTGLAGPEPSGTFHDPGQHFQGHGLCLSPRPHQPLRGSDLGLGYELGLIVYCPVMPLPQSSLHPMCTYPDVLLYLLSFPCCRVARILKRFVT